MPVVVMPDGQHVMLPAEAPGSGAGETFRNIAGFLGETGKKIGASALNSADAFLHPQGGILPAGVGTPKPPALDFQNKFHKLLAGTADDLNVPPADPNNPSLYDKATAGIGGMLGVPIGPGGVGNIFPMLASGGIGGITGELGKRGLGSITDDPVWKSRFAKTGEIFGNLLGGGLTAFITGPKQSVGKQDIREALRDTPPAAFDTARANAEAAIRSGAKTATGAEMFSPDSPIMALANQTRSTILGNALQTKTTGRKADLGSLGTTFQDRIAPPVDANTVANLASRAADGTIQTAKSARDTGIRNRLANAPPIAPHEVAQVEAWLQQQSNRAGISPSEQAAYREAASKMRDAHGQIITDPQALSLRLVEMQNAPKNPNFTGFQGSPVNKVDVANALHDARGAIGTLSPDFSQALDEFGHFSQNVLAPMREGPLGTLANRNPNNTPQTPMSRLEALTVGNEPNTVSATARTLSSPVLTNGTQVAPEVLARAIAQNKLRNLPTNPGNVIRGTEHSPAQAQFEALLDAGGSNTSHIMEPLSVADRLQGFQNVPNRNEMPKMGVMQYIRPFRTLDMMATGKMQKASSNEIATLLADHTPEGITKLQQIAMFDPAVRKMLVARAAIPPFIEGDK